MNGLLVITVVLALFVLKACAANKTQADPFKTLLEQRIIQGADARPGQFPWALYFVASKNKPKLRIFCTGVLITPKSAMTAAHCCFEFDFFQVVIGKLTLDTSHFVRTTKNCKEHEKYNPNTLRNDVAIMHIPKIKTNLNVRPISMPRGSELRQSFVNVKVAVCGWGEELNGRLSRTLKFVYLKVISNKQCKKSFNIVTDTIICATGVNRKSTCRGDSGGSLVQFKGKRGVFVGITSFGPFQCGTKPSAYSRVTKYISWINKNK